MCRANYWRRLVVVSGPSGCGKDTVVARLMHMNRDISLSVSYTSRKKRDYEVEGEHYFFVGEDEFLKLIKDGKMMEYTEYAGNYYGTPVSGIEQKIAAGQIVVLVIELCGARNVKRIFESALLVFIAPPSMEELEKRLSLRHTESSHERKRRLEIAEEEMLHAAEFDSVIKNITVEECARELDEVIREWVSGS